MDFTELFGTGVVSEITQVSMSIDYSGKYGITADGRAFKFRTNLKVERVPQYLEALKSVGLDGESVAFGLEAYGGGDGLPPFLLSSNYVAMYVNHTRTNKDALLALSRTLTKVYLYPPSVTGPVPHPTLAKMFGASLQPAVRIKPDDECLAEFVAANPEAALREFDEVTWQTENHMFKVNYEAPGIYIGAYYNSPVGDPCEPSSDDLCFSLTNEKLSIVVNDLFVHWSAHKDSAE
jgi:hypothetical protein